MRFINTLAEGWSKYLRRRARINELRALSCGDMRRLTQETGLTFAELVTLAKSDGDAAELLYRRMSTLGLDAKNIEPVVLRDMQRCCSECDSKTLCAHELEDKPKAAAWPSYCPNKQTLEALNQTTSK